MVKVQRNPKLEKKIIERYRQLGKRAPIFEKDTLSINLPNQIDRKFTYEFFKYDNMGGLHLEYSASGKFSVIGTERGQITYQTDSDDLEDIMFELYMSELTSLAQKFEGHTRFLRDDNVDSRRVWMPLAVSFMAMIKPGWGTGLQEYYNATLIDYPFSWRHENN